MEIDYEKFHANVHNDGQLRLVFEDFVRSLSGVKYSLNRNPHGEYAQGAVDNMWLGWCMKFTCDCNIDGTHPFEIQVCKSGNWGQAFDTPDVRRAYTYTDMPGNLAAAKLGVAANLMQTRPPAGDTIDKGLGLLKTLHEKGFGVFELPNPKKEVKPTLE